MELADFLLARIAEDEAVAESIDADPFGVFRNHGGTVVKWVALCGDRPWRAAKARVLAECEAKRLLVTEYLDAKRMRDEIGPTGTMEQARTFMLMQSILMAEYPLLAKFAAVDADHPDYRDEWSR